jgi:hypothetical protein
MKQPFLKVTSQAQDHGGARVEDASDALAPIPMT